MAKGSVELVTTAIILTIVIVIIRFARREPLIYIKKKALHAVQYMQKSRLTPTVRHHKWTNHDNCNHRFIPQEDKQQILHYTHTVIE